MEGGGKLAREDADFYTRLFLSAGGSPPFEHRTPRIARKESTATQRLLHAPRAWQWLHPPSRAWRSCRDVSFSGINSRFATCNGFAREGTWVRPLSKMANYVLVT